MAPPCTVFVGQYIFLEPLYRTLVNIAIPPADFSWERRDAFFVPHSGQRMKNRQGFTDEALPGVKPSGRYYS